MSLPRQAAVLLACSALLLGRHAAAQGTPAAAPVPAAPAPPAEPNLDQIDQRLRVIERRWEVDQEIAAERKAEERKNPPGVAVGYGKDGVAIKTADGKFQFRFRPLI